MVDGTQHVFLSKNLLFTTTTESITGSTVRDLGLIEWIYNVVTLNREEEVNLLA